MVVEHVLESTKKAKQTSDDKVSTVVERLPALLQRPLDRAHAPIQSIARRQSRKIGQPV